MSHDYYTGTAFRADCAFHGTRAAVDCEAHSFADKPKFYTAKKPLAHHSRGRPWSAVDGFDNAV